MSQFLTDFQARVLNAVRGCHGDTCNHYRTVVRSTPSATQKALDVLVKRGYVEAVKSLPGSGVGKPYYVYYPVDHNPTPEPRPER